ncbi:alpha/beta fold hydrolase [Marinobacter halodurans]|uniref:alpha/beta fold hydrolase n=1 Tax=Marinobacter halodurans TaxID=2528979 RepID=UPI0013F155B9|nr:alpha/beta hydrolase [Marinobacter halodurans]
MPQSNTAPSPQAPATAFPDEPFVQTDLPAADGHRVPVYVWRARAPRAVIHIAHGMAEHAQRYRYLARDMVQQGYTVVAHDHRGHGPATPDDELGHFADDNGWQRVMEDLGQVQSWIRDTFADLPCYLLGHSMGSFIAQSYLTTAKEIEWPAGLILSGSNRDSRLKLQALRLIVALAARFQGRHQSSTLVHALTFGAFAKQVPHANTDFDWLSTDEAAVKAYMSDPHCGFDCTNQLWSDLGSGLAGLLKRGRLQRIPARLPILILSGAQDPVGEFGRGTRRLASAYRASGHTDVTSLVFEGMRHEPFNERNRSEVLDRLLAWLARQRPTPHNPQTTQ